jgi:hypothetical protein
LFKICVIKRKEGGYVALKSLDFKGLCAFTPSNENFFKKCVDGGKEGVYKEEDLSEVGETRNRKCFLKGLVFLILRV